RYNLVLYDSSVDHEWPHQRDIEAVTPITPAKPRPARCHTRGRPGVPCRIGPSRGVAAGRSACAARNDWRRGAAGWAAGSPDPEHKVLALRSLHPQPPRGLEVVP